MRRIRQLLAANCHALLDKAEDPEKMLRALLHEMDEARSDGRRALESFGADRARLERQLNRSERQARRWQSRAEQALQAGDEDRAREAVARRHDAAAKADKLKVSLERLTDVEAELKTNLERLEARRAEAQERCRSLAERNCRRRITASYASPADRCLERSRERWDRIESRLERIEAEIEAYDMTAVDKQAEEIIDRELAALKQRVEHRED